MSWWDPFSISIRLYPIFHIAQAHHALSIKMPAAARLDHLQIITRTPSGTYLSLVAITPLVTRRVEAIIEARGQLLVLVRYFDEPPQEDKSSTN